MRRSSPSTIGSAIASTLEKLGIAKKLRRYEVIDLWPSIVGERIAQVSRPERFSEGTLFVIVDQATWRNELLFLKKELIEKINTAMQEEVVREIVFR